MLNKTGLLLDCFERGWSVWPFWDAIRGKPLFWCLLLPLFCALLQWRC